MLSLDGDLGRIIEAGMDGAIKKITRTARVLCGLSFCLSSKTFQPILSMHLLYTNVYCRGVT